MKTLQFKCKLLTDVILNQKAATEGPNQTLDFIPGSNFLGIVASQIYKSQSEVGYDANLMEIFHSGKVRFGDAHPSKGDFRGLHVPASMYYPKLKKASELCYIHHKTNHNSAEIKNLQLKQCRTGYFDFSSTEATPINVDTNFAIKSAYDRDKRRAEDEKMYGYQSLRKGIEMYFEVEVENDALVEDITRALVGDNKRVGRSRTAQFGLVSIEETQFSQIESNPQSDSETFTSVYADARLIFLDEETGMPTFRPTPKQLGLDDENAKILWEYSQIRTFQYAPWNFKRQCFDTDRVGIEKGSVFVVTTKAAPSKSQYVGSYRNEGFGKVIYNPTFLNAKADGKAEYRLMDAQPPKANQISEVNGTTPLLEYIQIQHNEELKRNNTYQRVNELVTILKESNLSKEQFASQWGSIRRIAFQNKNVNSLINEIDTYLSHGVAKEKWQKGGRKAKLINELNKSVETKNIDLQLLVINLASQMAKESKLEVKK